MAIVNGRGVSTGRAQADVTSGRNNADVSQREDLANFISMITREETPFISSIGKAKATAIYHEWQTDTLEAPGNSRLVEGAEFGTDAALIEGAHRTRLGNYTQINGKTIAVSGTRRAVDQAGVADEYAYQLKKRGTELRRDVEFDIVHSYNVATGSGTRKMGGFQAFINDAATCNYVGDFEAPSAAGVGSATVTGVSAADNTRSALALSDIDEVMQKIYEEGGKATRIMLSPKLRRDFSDLMVTDSGVRRNIDQSGKLRQSVDVYMSDFGDLMVVPNYIMGLSNNVDFGNGNVDVADFAALVYDPQWFAVATLRPLAEVDVGQKGDSTVGMMVEETTLEVRNPKGCGAIYGLE
jgi:hypothetical protein